MKRSNYTYFFEIDSEYVGYSYLSDDYAVFPLEKKEHVERILKYPDEIVTNIDADIYSELCNKKCLIRDDFDEYNFLLRLHRQFVHRQDWLAFTIVPTMACNCKCSYCYEFHQSLKTSKMSREVIDNLKKYIASKVGSLNMLSISWFGGEPLLCMDIIKEISEFCLSLCDKEDVLYVAGMTSNGILLNEKNAQTITDCGIHSVQITLDGSKKNHDKTRVTVGGKPTFDIIYNNILNYLDVDEKKRVALRIHVSPYANKEDIVGIIETLNLFDEKYRGRIAVYTHVLYTACSEKWSSEYREKCDKNLLNAIEDIDITKKLDITTKIRKGAMELGYAMAYGVDMETRGACALEADGSWVVRPDGYLNKCTVGIEKERAIAKLTKNGIELFPERFFKTIKKEFSRKLYERCRDCQYLPFCWQGCMYQHYQNPDIDNFIKTQCYKGKTNWMMKRRRDSFKYRYIEEKRER